MSERNITYETKWQGPPAGYRRCHASCCMGETDLGGDDFGTRHDMQAILDRHGFASGFFGKKHERVLQAIAEAFHVGAAWAKGNRNGRVRSVSAMSVPE